MASGTRSRDKNYFEWKEYKNFLEWKKERNDIRPETLAWEKIDYFSQSQLQSVAADGDPTDLTWYVKVVVTRTKECDIYVTNLIEVWLEELTFDDFDTKLKVLNPNLEGGNAKNFLDVVKSITVGSHPLKTVVVERDLDGDSYLKIQYKSTYDGVPFSWEFDGTKASIGEAKKMIIDPLLIMLAQYQRREKELMDLLLKKDREIDAYSGKVFRKNIETPKFIAHTWNANYENSESFYDVCREYRSETLHPFQDIRFRSMCSSVDDALDFLDFVQSEKERDASDTIKVEEEEEEIELPHQSISGHGIKRKMVFKEDDDADKEPDTTVPNSASASIGSPSRPTRKKQILRL